MFITSVELRKKYRRESRVRKSEGRAFLCFTKDVIDPCVYYIDIYFSFFSVKV